jgi:hypothetical protein
MIVARPATREDVQKFYPGETCSFKAWVAEMDDEPRGIIGLALTRPQACMFSAFEPEFRPHLKSLTVLRLIKKAERAVKDSRTPVVALAQADEPTAPIILKRLGFKPMTTTDDGEIWGT